MARRATRITSTILAGLLLTCIGAGVAHAEPDDRPSAKSPDSESAVPDSGISADVFAGIQAIRDFGPSQRPDVYTGIATNDPTSIDVLVIYLSTDDEAVRRQFLEASGVPENKVRFEVSARSAVEFSELNAQIARDVPSLQAAGVDVTGWGLGPGFVEQIFVGTTEDGPSADRRGEAQITDELLASYGADVEVVQAPAPGVDTGRVDDNAEWYGGDFLSIAGAGCTNSFAVRWKGHANQYVMTAGHCGDVGQNVINKAASPINIGTGSLIGGITNKLYSPVGYDAALIAADGSRGIWRGSSAAPTGTITVTNVIDPWEGAPACSSGAYEGEYCGWTFVGAPGCYPWTFDGGQTGSWCNLQKMTNPSSQAIGSGDSGGPVYASIGGVVYGYGIIKGAASSTTCSNWNTYFNGSRKCSGTAYINNLSSIMNQWNLELDP